MYNYIFQVKNKFSFQIFQSDQSGRSKEVFLFRKRFKKYSLRYASIPQKMALVCVCVYACVNDACVNDTCV